MVSSLNGAITYDGKSAPISNSIDRLAFKIHRSLASAVVVGSKNVVAESYFAPLKRPLPIDQSGRALERYPHLVIVTNGQTSFANSALLRDSTDRFTIITSKSGFASVDTELRSAKVDADVIIQGDTSVDMNSARLYLDERFPGLKVVEGGPSILTNMLRAKVLDQLALSVTPKIVPTTFPFIGNNETSICNLTLYRHLVIADTLLLVYRIL